MAATRKSAKTTAAAQSAEAFTAEERAAMKERAGEVRTSRRRGAPPVDEEPDVLAKIAGMAEPDRVMAERVHRAVMSTPGLTARLWYGMPAYAKDGKVLCFFQPAQKFKTRYATLGFSDEANLDDGAMWPTSYALTELSAADAKRITALVRQAVT